MTTSDTTSSRTATAVEPAVPTGLSRRSLLAAFGLAGVGTLGAISATQLFGCDTAVAATPTKTPLANKPKPLHKRRPKPTKKLTLGADGTYNQPTPYTVQASCDLSEDFYLTDEVLIDVSKGDKVMPFTNPHTGLVEAIVLTKSTVNHLYRTPDSVTGWTYERIDTIWLVNNFVSDAAIAANGNEAVLMVEGIVTTSGEPPIIETLSLSPTNEWVYVAGGTPGFATFSGSVQAGVAHDGLIYFYNWVASTDSKAQTNTYVFHSMDKQLNHNSPATAVWPTSESMVDAQLQLYVAGPENKIAHWAAVTMRSEADQSLEVQLYPLRTDAHGDLTGAFGSPAFTNSGITEVLAMSYTPANTSGYPAVAWQTDEGDIEFVDETGAQANLYPGANFGLGQVALWQQAGEYTFAVLEDGKLNVITQIGTGGQSGFTAPIPMLGGLGSVFAAPGDATGTTLFAIDLDNGVSMLTRDATGWTQNVLHTDGATVDEVSAWRIKLSELDANGVGVVGGSVRLTPDRPVGIWIDGDQSIWATPDTPATVTLGTGEIVLSIPAAELDAAQLTAQALDADGNATGAPLTILPDTDVRNFLAGTDGLTSVGDKLTGAALTNAQNKTWDSTTQTYVASGPLLPGLVNAGSDAAGQIATAFQHTMSLAANAPGTNGAQAGCLDFTTNPPTFSTSSDPNAYESHKTGDTSWWDKAKKDVESVFHGIRHAAMAIKKMITTFASDVAQWTINLVIDLGDGIEHLINWVVTGVKDAIHAISGFFHSLGADIKQAWDWLKNFVLGVMKDADTNASQLAGWFDDLTTAGTGLITEFETMVDGFFTGLEDDVSAKIQTLKAEVTGTTVAAQVPQPTTPTDTGSSDWGKAFTAIEDVFSVLGHSPVMWLWNKIKSHVQSVDKDDINIEPSNYTSSATDLSGKITTDNPHIANIKSNLLNSGSDYQSAQGVKSSDTGKLLDIVNTVAVDILELINLGVDEILEAIKQILIDLIDLLESEFEIPLIGELLELAGIDATTSWLRITTLIVAYPATIIHNLWVGEGPLFAFDEDGSGLLGKGAGADKNGFGLDIAAAVVQFFWADVDAVMDVLSLPSKSGSSAQSYMDALNALDFTLPIAMTILQWPTPPKSTTTPRPCSQWNFNDASVWGDHNDFLYGIIITTIAPWWFQGLGWIFGKVMPNDSQLEQFNTWVVPWIQAVSACVNNILGAWWQYDNIDPNTKTPKTDKADAVLDWTIPNLSYLDCPLGIADWVESSEGVTMAIKTAVDCVANYGATAFCIQGAIAAKNS